MEDFLSFVDESEEDVKKEDKNFFVSFQLLSSDADDAKQLSIR